MKKDGEEEREQVEIWRERWAGIVSARKSESVSGRSESKSEEGEHA